MWAMMHPYQANVKARCARTTETGPERKGNVMELLSFIVAAALIVGPLAILAYAAARFGVDSRPGLDDNDQRPWLVPTA
jgi:hypothetical protein